MNKKLLMSFLVGVLAIAVVSAGIMAYYGQVNAKIDVTQPISIRTNEGDFTGDIFTDELEVIAGEKVRGATITIKNSLDTERDIVISEYSIPEGIDVSYMVCIFAWYNGGACAYHSIDSGDTVTVPAKTETHEGEVDLMIYYDTDDMLGSGTYIVKTRIDSE